MMDHKFFDEQISLNRMAIRKSELYLAVTLDFQNEAIRRVNTSADLILNQINTLTQGLTPEEMPIKEVLQTIATQEFREFSIELEDSTWETTSKKYLNEFAKTPTHQQQLFALVADEILQILGRRWALFIHGSIQTQLSAVSLMIQEASKNKNWQRIAEAVQIVTNLLDKPASNFVIENQSLIEVINNKLTPWSGLLKIEITIDSELHNHMSPRNLEIGEILSEAISNSARHGRSRNIELDISDLDHTDISITIADDSKIGPPAVGTEAGFGTKIFNSFSDGRWKINRDELNSRTTLFVLFELEGVSH